MNQPIVTLILLNAAGDVLHTLPKQRLPALELLLARASKLEVLSLPSRFDHSRWQAQLLQTMGLPQGAAPSASVSWVGSGCDATSDATRGTWFHATPMHYAVTLNGLSMHPVDWTEGDGKIIEQIISNHIAQDGFEWRQVGRQFYFRHEEALDVQTTAAEWASRVPLRGVLPSGAQGRKINQLATEIQMMLYEHPKLQRRSMPINALWLWGNGLVAVAPQQQALPNAWSNEPFVCGLFRLHGEQCNEVQTLVESFPRKRESSKKIVSLDSRFHGNDEVVLNQRLPDAVIVARTTDLQSAESEWFAPLLTALRRGRWRKAQVMFGDVQFTVTKSDLWHFWRRAQPIGKLLQSRAPS